MVFLRGILMAAALSVALTPRVAARQAPNVDDLRTRAGEYVERYASKVSGVSLEEQFLLIEIRGGQTRVPQRIASDLVIVALGTQVMGLRDPFSIDKRPVREHRPRVVQALTNPTPATWALVQQYVRANANLLLHNVVLWYSDPMLALQFVAPSNQATLTYKLEGRKTLNGVQVYGVGFKESADGPRILSEIPGNAQSSGRLWVDPETGAIHMTELWVQSRTDVVRVQVDFAPDPTLALLLPRKASHTFQWREWGDNFTSTMGGSPIKLSFESNAEYANARYTRIDLGRGGK